MKNYLDGKVIKENESQHVVLKKNYKRGGLQSTLIAGRNAGEWKRGKKVLVMGCYGKEETGDRELQS